MKGAVLNTHDASAVVRDGVTRAVAVIGLAGVALIHLLDLPSKFQETPYLGWMYIGAIVAAVAIAAGLIRSGSRKVWAACAALPLAVLVGFVLSRTTGLPSATDDVGNWGEPLGMASMFVEGALVLLASAVLIGERRPAPRRRLSTKYDYAPSGA